MKEELIGKNKAEQGSSILEVLIALAVLTLGISAVIMLVFANQTLKLDSETSGEALYKAKDILESTRASSTISTLEFNSIISIDPLGFPPDSIYSKELVAEDLTPCRKEVTSRITWSTEPTRPQKIELKTDLVDIPGAFALGGDCAAEPPEGGWTNSDTLLSRDLKGKSSPPPAGYNDNPSVNSDAGIPATDVDVLNKTIYMTALSNKDNFFILDGKNILNGVMPPIVGSLSIEPGFNALDVAGNYAYVASASSTSSESSDEFVVIDVTNPSSPNVEKSITLDITPNCPIYCPGGAQAVYYYNGHVYVGTHRIGGQEFYVLSVSAPYSPTDPYPLGSLELDHNVNAIVVRGNYAYLATSGDTNEIIVLDVSDPTAGISEVGWFDANMSANDDEDGMSLFLLGNRLYLGRERVNNVNKRDFYILDITNPLAITEIGSKNLDLNSGAEVVDIRVSGKFAFLAINDPNDGFQVLDISNPTSIGRISTFNFSQKTTGLDYEDGFIYTSNESNDALRIIRPAQCSDKIDDDLDGKIDIADPQCHTDGDANNPASYDPEDDDES